MNTGYLLVIISTLIWGSIGIFVRFIDQSPEVIVFFRVFIAFLVLSIGSFYRKYSKPRKDINSHSITKKEYIILFSSGIFISLNWLFFFLAIKSTTIASATMSYYTAPVIVTILSIFILKESINKKTALAVSLSFMGIILMTSMSKPIDTTFNIKGVIFGIVAAFFYALVTISVKKLKNIPSETISLFQMGVSSIIFLPAIRSITSLSIRSIVLLAIIGVIHTCIALNLYFEGIKKIKVQHVGVLSYIDPLTAIILGIIFFHETPKVNTLLGGTLILIATYLILNKNKNNS